MWQHLKLTHLKLTPDCCKLQVAFSTAPRPILNPTYLSR